MCAPPCTTFSQCRHPALRSHARPRGLVGLLGDAADQVRAANLLVDNMCCLLEDASRQRIPWIIENPWASILWSDRKIQKLAGDPSTSWCKLHMCAFGARWMKHTALLCSRIPDSSSLNRVCRPQRTGPHGVRICSYSGCPHIILRGRDSCGIHWTRRAQEYSPGFANELARVMHNAAFTHELSEIFGEKRKLWEPPLSIAAKLGRAPQVQEVEPSR